MLELLRKRRSIRKYQNKEVEKDKIEQLIKAALLSPSSRNICPWEFIVVNEKEKLIKLSQTKEHGSVFLKDASCAIVVLGDSAKSDVWIEDASIASIFTHLMAESMDLGSCWIQIRNRMHNKTKTSEQYIREILNIPQHISIESIIAIGYKNEDKKVRADDELNYNKVFFNEYNKAFAFSHSE